MKLRLAVAAVLTAAALVSTAPPASANAPGGAVCHLNGVMTFAPANVLSVPVSAPGPGTWGYTNVSFVCAGLGTDALLPIIPTVPGVGNQLIGPAPFTAGGLTGPPCGGPALPSIGQFCGTWTAGPFLTGASCAGSIGGPGPPNGEPVPPTVDSTTDAWSLIYANLILGEFDCDTGPGMTATSTGAIALVALPLPGACAAPVPVAGPPILWFCSFAVSGVAVLVDTTVV